jgi:outer membrane biosynthesis protein TonB
MRHLVLASVLVFSLCSGAYAQGVNPYSITIIQDDGTKAVVDIGKPQEKAQKPEEPAKAPEQASPPSREPEPAPSQEPIAQKPNKAGVAPKPSKKSAPPEQIRPKPIEKTQSAVNPQTVKPPQKPAPEQREVLAPGEFIAPERAFSIASEDAPPSSGFKAYKAVIDDTRPGYGFIFETEQGPYKVVVDARDGMIAISRYENQRSSAQKPGHLPVR